MSLAEKIHAKILKGISRLLLNYHTDFNPEKHRKGLIFCQMGIGNCILILPVIRNLISYHYQLKIITGSKTNYDLLQSQFSDANICFIDIYKLRLWKKLKP